MKNVKKRFIDITAMTFIAIVFLLIISWQSIYAEEKIHVTIAGGHIPTISGSIGVPIESQTITLNFGDGVRLSQTLTAKTDITNWFSCETTDFPHGIYVVVKETALVGSSSITVEFYGTTEGASRDTITMQVKRSMLNGVSTSGTQWIDVEFTSATKPSFNIVRNSRVPDGFCGTGLFIWFKTSDGKSTIAETKGWKLNGEKGKAITSNNELEVFIYGNFTREYAAGTDISSWFTGNLIYTDTSTYEVTHSFLPGGVTAKLKNKISRGDSRFTIVFTGTPTQGSRDLIAITIPAGVTTHPTTDGSLGDVSTPIQVNNITGKFSYSITSDDYYDSFTECVKITYPEAEIKAGQVITESDSLIATYELVGKDANGNPLKYDNVKVGDKLRFVTVAGKVYYDGGLYEDIGLEGTVKSFSSDRTKMYVLLTGTVKTQRVYPYTIRTYRFTLNWPSVTAGGRFVNGYDAGESKFKVVAPNPTITIEYDPDYYEGPISATYKIGDKKVTYGTRVFWINFGDDALNLDYLTSAHLLPILYVQGAKGGGGNWNGIRFLPVEGYQKGSKRMKVILAVSEEYIGKSYSGYLTLAFPKSALQKMNEIGTEPYYYVESNKIYIDFELSDVTEIETEEVTINGVVNIEMQYAEDESTNEDGDGGTIYKTVKGITVNPISTEKVYFNVTLDPIVYVPKDYKAGDSFGSFITLYEQDVDKTPFYNQDWYSYLTYDIRNDLRYPTVRAAEDIAKGYGEEGSVREIKVMIDLNEFKAVQNSKGHLGLEMYAETKRTLFIRTSSGSLDSNMETFRTSPLINLNLRYKYESETGSGSVADSGYPVDFENKEGDVIIYATDDSGKTVSSTYFNLTQEKIASGISYKCYSLDGGNKWKETSKFTDKQIDAMLKKGMTLSIANKYDKKTKKPADDAVIYTFDTINKRPAAPKLKAEFKTYADPTGFTPGQWTLADKSNTALSKEELAKYEIGIAASDKKTVSSAGYSDIPTDTGIDFVMTSGKTADSTIYFVRTKATEDTPASKAAKLTVKGQGKASKLKVDYKKEILKAKKGMIVFFGDTLSEDSIELKDVPKKYSDYTGKYIVVDEALAKTGIDLSGYITDTRNTIMVWTAATEKKASTLAQVIKLAKRDSIKAEKLTVTGGKFKLDKKYEVYIEAKGKWGGLPKISESCELKIRLKATAKGGAESDSSYAASNTGFLKISYDVIDANKNKSGITAAEIVMNENIG